jgi:spore germination protein KC
MPRRRLAAWLLLFVTLVPAVSGCWGRKELEEVAYVMAIGVDKGKESLYGVTFAIALPGRMAGGKEGGGEGKPLMLTTVEAPSVAAAMSIANSYLSRQLSLRHTKALFMGEELARESGMFTMDEFVRFRETRRTIFYIVTKGKAADFLDGMEPQLEKDPQRFIQMMTYNVQNTGMMPIESQIQHFVTSVNTGYAEPITYYAALKEEEGEGEEGEPKEGKTSGSLEGGFKAGELPRKGGPNIELLGGAAFDREKMVGVLTGEDMRMILMLQGKFKRGLFSIPDPHRKDLFVSMEMKEGRPVRLNVDVSGARPRLTGLVTLEAELLTIQANRDYTEPELQPVLEQAAGQAIATRIAETVTKTQEWRADVVGFGSEVVKKFPTVAQWEQYKWPERFPNAEVDIRVKVILRRFGKQLSPPEARE